MAASVQNNASKNNDNYTPKRGDRVAYKCTLKKFHEMPHKNGNGIFSSVFPKNKGQWKLKIYPQGYKEEDAGWLSVLLIPVTEAVLGIEVMCSITVIQMEKEICSENIFRTIENMEGYEFRNLIKRSELSIQDDPTDSITIQCEVKVLKTPTSDLKDRPIFKVQSNGLSRDFKSLYKNPKLTDFTVISGDKKFPVHKVVLASRSPVFAAMFEPKEANENVKNEVKIENFSTAVVEKLLEFIYTDDVSEIEKFAQKLLIAAEKYGLEDLKNLCEKSLFETINPNNAQDLLEFADFYRAYYLRDFIIQYIANHLESFEILNLPTDLMTDVLNAGLRVMGKKWAEEDAKCNKKAESTQTGF